MKIADVDIGVLVLGYSRPVLFEKAVRSIKNLGLPKSAQKYAVIDGPKNKGPAFERNKEVQKVAKFLLSEGELNSVKIRRKNLGTMENVYKSVTEILENHEYIFVLEDDLEITPFANGSIYSLLNKLGGDINAFSIYCMKSFNNDLFYSNRYSSQAWGTSNKSWKEFNPHNMKNINLNFMQILKLRIKCGGDIYSDFKSFQKGKLDTWANPWNVFNFLNSNKMIYPPKSYVINNSHLIGAERTEGVFFKYEIAREPLQNNEIKKININKRYVSHFSLFSRLKRSLSCKIYKLNIFRKERKL